jgi:hypothetical protein
MPDVKCPNATHQTSARQSSVGMLILTGKQRLWYLLQTLLIKHYSPFCGLAYRRVSYQEDRAASYLLEKSTATIDFSEAQTLECTKAQMFGPPAAFLKRKFEGDDLFDFQRVRFRAKQLIPHQEPWSRIGLAGTTFICIEPASMHFGLTKPNSRHRLTMINIQICSGHKIESLSETRWTLDVNFRDSSLLRRFDAGLFEIDGNDKLWIEDYTKLFPKAENEELPDFFRVQRLHSLHNM